MKDATIGATPPATPAETSGPRRSEAPPAEPSAPPAAADGVAVSGRSGSASAKGVSLTESSGKPGGGMPLTGVWNDITSQVGVGVFPGNLFAYRSTDFDRYVITARFIRAYSQFP